MLIWTDQHQHSYVANYQGLGVESMCFVFKQPLRDVLVPILKLFYPNIQLLSDKEIVQTWLDHMDTLTEEELADHPLANVTYPAAGNMSGS